MTTYVVGLSYWIEWYLQSCGVLDIFVYSVVDYTANENKFISQTTQQWPFMSIHVKGLWV
jgi:hypothetical protein